MKKKIVGLLVCMLMLIPVLSAIATVNQSPMPLDPPLGPSEGIVGNNYTFCIDIPTDPDGEPFYVMWDWGDGSDTGWIGPYSSGETACASHAWDEPGEFEIHVKLKNKYGEIVWSVEFIIHIYPAELEIEVKGGIGVTAEINILVFIPAECIVWSIEINGGILLLPRGRAEDGWFSTPDPGETEIISIFVLGFGRMEIIVHAGNVSETINGFVFGPLVII